MNVARRLLAGFSLFFAMTLTGPHEHSTTAQTAADLDLSLTPNKTTVEIDDIVAYRFHLEHTGTTAFPHLAVLLGTPDALGTLASVGCPGSGSGSFCDLGVVEPGAVVEITYFVEVLFKTPIFPVFARVSDPDTFTDIAQVSAPQLTIIGPPEILDGPFATNITRRSAFITWTTDDPSSSLVRFGLTDAYGQTRSKQKLVTDHSIKLTGLQPGTMYHFQVESTDAEGPVTWFFDLEFTTVP